MKQKRVQFVLPWLRRSAGSRQQSLLNSRVRTLGSEVGAVEKQVHGLFNLSVQGRSLITDAVFTLVGGLDSVEFVPEQVSDCGLAGGRSSAPVIAQLSSAVKQMPVSGWFDCVPACQ